MSSWLKDLERWSGDTNDEAFVAFRAMGTNAIPGLIAVFQSGGPKWQKTIAEFNRKQSLIKLPYREPIIREMAAAWALYAMGPEAKPALPVLSGYLFNTQHVDTVSAALAGVNSGGVTVLLGALTNNSASIRYSAVHGLSWERADQNLVVPALITCLHDSGSAVRRMAVVGLGEIGAKPELVVPALINAYSPTNVYIHPHILMSLGLFKTNAKPAIPLVLNALKDPNTDVRIAAVFALEQIDPDAAAKAGAK